MHLDKCTKRSRKRGKSSDNARQAVKLPKRKVVQKPPRRERAKNTDRLKVNKGYGIYNG